MQEHLEAGLEIIDVVNDKDEVIGAIPRYEAEQKRLSNIRTVNGFIVNKSGDLWIPRRSQMKRKIKGCLDFSVGGYVKTGESYDEAFTRERTEEIKNNTDTVQSSELGYLNPHEHPVSSFMKIYKFTMDREPEYDISDFSEAKWISPQNLVDQVMTGDNAKSDLIPVVKLFFLPPT